MQSPTLKVKSQVEDNNIGREANVGKDEVHSKREQDNPNIEITKKKRNIVVKMIDVTSVSRKTTLHEIVE